MRPGTAKSSGKPLSRAEQEQSVAQPEDANSPDCLAEIKSRLCELNQNVTELARAVSRQAPPLHFERADAAAEHAKADAINRFEAVKTVVDTTAETNLFISSNSPVKTVAPAAVETDSHSETTSACESANKELGSGPTDLETFSMKFPKPKTLLVNDYPDLGESHPDILKRLVQEIIHPAENSPLGKYLDSSISFLKEKNRNRAKKAEMKIAKVHNLELGRRLYFVSCSPWVSKAFRPAAFRALVDTGAVNSLLHISVVNQLGLDYKPLKMTLSTAIGRDDDAIKGLLHLKFGLVTANGDPVLCCTNFIVTTRLNGLAAIIGAEFLMDNDSVKSITRDSITLGTRFGDMGVPISETELVQRTEDLSRRPGGKLILLTCRSCGNKEGPPKPEPAFESPITVRHSSWSTVKDEIEQPSLKDSKSYFEPDHPFKVSIENPFSKDSKTGHSSSTLAEEKVEGMIDLDIFAHSFKKEFENETLPPSEESFEESVELKFEVLDKTISLEDGDYSGCPTQWLVPLKNLLRDFHDRFSKKKLDIEVTDLYEADLETFTGRKVIQRVRTLPQHKFEFALKAVRQLEQAGVVRESDSPWRSNVVMIPKPIGKNELRATTKADYQKGDQHEAQHYRICLDFRDLNDILVFPKQVAFPTLDKFLYKLRNKVVVSIDISSSFYVIPIREEDRYKTAFWLNDLAFEFNVLVMGLKSSPYHLKRFLDQVYGKKSYETYVARLSQRERELIPSSFEDIIVSFFDDVFIIGDDYEQTLANFKLCLMIARDAKIKFSVEKSSFLTTKVKILGYEFDTKDVILTMDKLKASAIQNLKKPSSLFELHSRLASFQYNSMFIPFLKHIAYPLHFLLRKGQFTWGPIEEQSWQLLKTVSTLGLRLTVPDPSDNLVLSTDASKIAASACLFREKNGKLELVAVNSKYFSATDLNKCSYMLESIALAYGLKTYASYILNCTATVKIFTDAKALIYAKRNSTHSILLNSTLTYLQNFVSLVNVEIYHVPGTVNVLADVMSRAISDNLNCALPREHPISKQWAKVLPPLTENFGVTREALFEFLTKSLKPEPQDLNDRRQKRLMEPKTVQQLFDVTKEISDEQRYYSAIRLLEQWNDKYIKQESKLYSSLTEQFSDSNSVSSPVSNTGSNSRFSDSNSVPSPVSNTGPNSTSKQPHLQLSPELQELAARVHAAKLELDLVKQEKCFQKLDEIMDKLYSHIKGTPLYRRILENLKEAANKYLLAKSPPLTSQKIKDFKLSIDRKSVV